MSAPKVDVLAVMDAEIERAGGEAFPVGRTLIAARAVVAELIEADREYDAARHNEWVISQSDDYAFTNGKTQLAAERTRLATERRSAALARIGSAS